MSHTGRAKIIVILKINDQEPADPTQQQKRATARSSEQNDKNIRESLSSGLSYYGCTLTVKFRVWVTTALLT